MKDKTIRRVVAFFLLISTVLVVVAVQAVRNINRSIASSDWVNRTHAIILEAEALRAELHAADGALRTYALTGNAADAAACREALARVEEHLEVGKALTRSDPVHRQQFAELATLADQRADFAREILRARQSGDAEAIRAGLLADAGGERLRDVHRKIEKLKDDQMALLAQRDRASYLQAQATRWTVWSGLMLDVLLLAGAVWLIRDDIGARRRAAAALELANEQLEGRVRERTADLAVANAQLSTENLERQWANHALEHQLRYNQLIVNSINDLVFVVTRSLNISRVNPAVVHLTGLEPAELTNQPLSRVVRLFDESGGAEAPMFDPLAQALKDGRDLRNRPARVEDKRGRQTAVRLALFPLRDGDKVVGGVVTLQVATAPEPMSAEVSLNN